MTTTITQPKQEQHPDLWILLTVYLDDINFRDVSDPGLYCMYSNERKWGCNNRNFLFNII